MGAKQRYRKAWEAWVKLLPTLDPPASFDEAYAYVEHGISGLFSRESRAVCKILRRHRIESIAEVGRNLGGTLFLFVCACPDLKYVRSVDIAPIPEIDGPLLKWIRDHGIEAEFIEADSTTLETPDRTFDFVFIDGLHTGDAVSRDIEIWKDHARLLGFHDYGSAKWRKHRKAFPDVAAAITAAAAENEWEIAGKRGRSDVVFRTPRAAGWVGGMA